MRVIETLRSGATSVTAEANHRATQVLCYQIRLEKGQLHSVSNRLIDLSYTAAAKLDMLRDGTAFVEVRALTPASPPDILTRTSETPPPES